MTDKDDIHAPYIQPRGPAYRDDQVDLRYSRYNDPIDRSPGRFAGNSHIHGDASPEVQAAVMDAIVDAAQRAGLDDKETAYVLATARFESGFNPDAAAGPTSAYRCVGRVLSGRQYEAAVPGEPSEYPAVSRWNADRAAARYLEPHGTLPPPDVFTGTWKNAECYPAKEGAAEQCNAVRLAIVQRGENLCGVVRDADASTAKTPDKDSAVVGTVVDGVAIMVVQAASQGSYLARASISSPGMGFRIVGGLAGATNAALEGVPITAHLMRDDSEAATAEMKRLSESCRWPE